MDRRTKELVVAELHDKLKNARLAVLAAYSGLNVETMTSLRNVLRRSDTEIRVVKNTLLRIASEDTDIKALKEHIKGPLALVLGGGDVVEPSKVLVDFSKKNQDFQIRVGMLDGKPLSREQLAVLASLPGREVLLAKLLSVMVGVQTSLVTVLSAVPRSFVQVIAAYRDKKGSHN
ncbi:MAG: 50S ribosomal protein L10 [Deltaproteobacteria bacterium]|nr:50S ribosomal protein L10 [Deltaproteobacteria bacterium]